MKRELRKVGKFYLEYPIPIGKLCGSRFTIRDYAEVIITLKMDYDHGWQAHKVFPEILRAFQVINL